MPQTLSVLPGEYAIARLDADARPPLESLAGPFWSVTRTPDEVSLVCVADSLSDGPQIQKGWAALKLHGPFPFELTGILASVLEPLRDAGIGIFAVSTFDTDYVLVAQERLPEALEALRAAGHHIAEG